MLSATTGTANVFASASAFSRVRFQIPATVTPGTSANALMCSRGHRAAADHGDAHSGRRACGHRAHGQPVEALGKIDGRKAGERAARLKIMPTQKFARAAG